MDKLLNKKIKVKQSNELTEAAYYLSKSKARSLVMSYADVFHSFSKRR
jgi:hypothetical protein